MLVTSRVNGGTFKLTPSSFLSFSFFFFLSFFIIHLFPPPPIFPCFLPSHRSMRYRNLELQERETEVNDAASSSLDLERAILSRFRQLLVLSLPSLRETAAAVARLDVLTASARIAEERFLLGEGKEERKYHSNCIFFILVFFIKLILIEVMYGRWLMTHWIW